MKKYLPVVVSICFCFACSNVEVKVNKEKLVSLGERIENKVEQGADSVKTKFNRLKDSLDKDGGDTTTIR